MNNAVSEQQLKQLLTKFRQSLSDVLQPQHDDYYLTRWLMANYVTDFDVEKSEADLRAHLKWREVVGADTIQDWTAPEVLRRFYPGGLYGFDKVGRPIWIEPLGHSDVKGLLRSARKSDILKLKVQHCEQIQNLIYEQRRKRGDQIDGLIVIFDLEHLGMQHLWRPAVNLVTDIVTIYEVQYPETLRRTFVVNAMQAYTDVVATYSQQYPETLTKIYVLHAPRIFPIAFNIVKPFLSEATKRKIVMLGRNWRTSLLHDIDADQLPVHWGGTATDPDGDPYCRSKVIMGGTVSREFYMPAHESIDRDCYTHVVIAHRSSLDLEFKVKVPESTLRWQFVTEGMDIGFSVKRLTADKKKSVVLLPMSRVHSNLVSEDGHLTCTEPGTYVVTFDNTYSWVHRKTLWYNIDVVEPINEMPPEIMLESPIPATSPQTSDISLSALTNGAASGSVPIKNINVLG